MDVGSPAHGRWMNDVCHEFGQPLRVQEIHMLQMVVLKVQQRA